MRDWKDTIFITRDRAAAVPDCPQQERETYAALPEDPALHDRYLSTLPCLHHLEHAARPPAPGDRPASLRVAAWNLERCAHPEASSALLAAASPDITFLSEMDVGMARTGQQHTPRAVLDPLGHDHLFGVEFLELGLGSAREKRLNEGRTNAHGFHGNVLSGALEIHDPVMIRFDRDANWFALDCDERRIGGRMAIAGRVTLADGELVVVSVHLESRMTAARRAEQMGLLMKALEDYAPRAPMIIGGDLNTDSDAWTLGKGIETGSDDWAAIKARTLDPVAYEPLFEVVREAGFAWDGANRIAPTVRETPQSGPRRYPDLKLDWFFTRGLKVAGARTVPALDRDGMALSDHDLILVDIALA